MKNFGTILRYFRTQSNISMSSLAEGICTKHYIYLIESGKRIPSVKIIDELSAKLNFDWRDYVDYANNTSPIEARQLIDRIEHYNRTCDVDSLCTLLNGLSDMPYLECYPVYIEIWIQKVNIYVYSAEKGIRDIEAAKTEFKEFIAPLADRDDFTFMPVIYLKSLNSYTALLIKDGKTNETLPIFRKLTKAVEKKKDITRYQPLYVDTYHNFILFYKKTKNYNKMRSCAIALMKYQERKCLIEKLPLTLILLGDACKGLKKYTVAYKYYKRAISVSRIIKNDFFIAAAEKKITKLY